MLKYTKYEWANAEKAIKKALELDPNSYVANHGYFQYLSTVGRPDEGLFYAIHAHELDPAQMPGNLAYAYFLARQYDKAIELFRQLLEKRPNEVQPLILLGETYVAKGMYREGVAKMQKAIALDNAPERWDRHPMLAYAYAMAGRRDEALKILNEQKRLAKKAPISPYNFAIIYTGLGDKDRAFEWLQKGYEQRARLVYRLKSRPMFDSLRSDPRYAELLRKMGLEP
jgi:tetratricopeptide (TPR) repeat protein